MGFDKDSVEEENTARSNAENLGSAKSSSIQPPPLQLKEDEDEKSSTLPHHEQVQSSLGSNAINSVTAHSASSASKSVEGMSAGAFASGNALIFADKPNKQNFNHEAAHAYNNRFSSESSPIFAKEPEPPAAYAINGDKKKED